MRGALARAREAVDDCLDLPASTLSGAELVAALDEAMVVQRKAAALVLELVGEIDRSGLPREQGATSTVAWLRHRMRVSASAARTLVADAETLDVAPAPLRDAVTSGSISPEQARVVGATLRTVQVEAGAVAADKAVGILLDWAGRFEPDGLRRLGHRILEHVAPQVAEDAQRRALDAADKSAQRDRYLNVSPTGDGRIRLSGLLDAETGAVLRAALDPLTRPGAAEDDRNPGQRRHDALAELCRLALRAADLPDSGGAPAQVVVTTSFDAMTGRLGVGRLDTGQPLSAATVRRLACDARILPAVLNGRGQVLDVGRQRRLFTGPIRRALVLRDGGCAFPGCDRPPHWAQGHHIRHWSDGGDTSVANGVLLCGHHHRAVHQDGWVVRMTADGQPEFVPPPWVDARGHPRRNEFHRRC
ncbi:DUF222 domain-containing protein [Plantactinospora siamensis]|uniref:DUF222 domain-containing protein n=1 Tax=Plantactinospora siamensis TaxID=555372 RepID=A0ABV6NXR9_9ACTN